MSKTLTYAVWCASFERNKKDLEKFQEFLQAILSEQPTEIEGISRLLDSVKEVCDKRWFESS